MCVWGGSSVLLPAVTKLLFHLWILRAAASCRLHLFTWATQILGFYYPAGGLCLVQTGCLCPARHSREPTAQSTGELLARYFEGLITSSASEFQLGAPVWCVRCAVGSPAAEWTSEVWVPQAGAALNQGWHLSAHPHGIKPKEHHLVHWCCSEVFDCKGTCNITGLAILLESVELF